MSDFVTIAEICIQETLSSLGLCSAFRPSASREQRYLAYKYLAYKAEI